MRSPSWFAIAVAIAVAACTGSSTRIEVAVTSDATVPFDQYQVRIGTHVGEVDPEPQFEVEIADAEAGQPTEVEVWGLMAGSQVAYGSAALTPTAHDTTVVAITLAPIGSCGTFCVVGATQCAGEAVETCMEQGDGCTGWSAPIACPATAAFCSNGACAPECVNECTLDTSRCTVDGEIQECAQGSDDTCTHWSTPAACPAQPPVCQNATTLHVAGPGTCEPGGSACTYAGSDETCADGCAAGACVTCPALSASEFPYTNATQMMTIAPCTGHVMIEAWGAQGGGPAGGRGGYAAGILAVTPGQTLYIEVGGSSGYNGGGSGVTEPDALLGIAQVAPANGGGASDVRLGNDQLASRVIVAGGGGGGPASSTVTVEYAGGSGGGGECGSNFCGGGGGVGVGATVGSTTDALFGYINGGAGASGVLGGAGGGGGMTSGGGGSCETSETPSRCGGTGSLGTGGGGAAASTTDSECFGTLGVGTAGGGGGWYGGGGTSTTLASGGCGGGGGGGGASWTGTLTSSTLTSGQQLGDGRVVITPLP